MIVRSLFHYGCLMLAGAAPALSAPAAVSVEIAAGAVDREETVASFVRPPEVTGEAELVRGGERLPLQGDGAGRAWFVLPRLAKGSTARFELRTVKPAATPPAMRAHREGRILELTRAGRTVLRYQAEAGELPRPEIPAKFSRGGYLHPVFTPAGRAVTDDYPANHLHHHGIWSPWTRTEFEGRAPDFWNMGDLKGRVEFVALEATTSGPVFAGFDSRQRLVDLLAKPKKVALHETWQVRAFNVGGTPKRPWNLFDLTITQTCATTSPLRLLKYHYGGLGFRGPWAWNGPANCRFLTSEGETDRVKANETRGRWCWIGGAVDGQTAGVVILCAPDNFRAPQPMRVNPTEPFFCFAPSQLGDWSIEPGQPYVACYRFVALDGEPNREVIERLWRDYAEPPQVTVVNH